MKVEELIQHSTDRTTKGSERYLTGCLLGSDGCDPVPDDLGHELKAVIRADISRNPPSAEKIPQVIDDIGGDEIAFHPDCQPLPRGLINVTANAVQG